MGNCIPGAAVSRAVAVFVLAVAVAGCASVRILPESFAGPAWQVTEIAGSEVPATHLYRVQFDGKRISGRFGCNQFSGSYRLEDERLIVGDTVSTLIGCPEPAASHEARAFQILRDPMKIDWSSGNRIRFSNARGSIALQRNN